MASPPIPILREKSVCFFVSVSTSSGHFHDVDKGRKLQRVGFLAVYAVVDCDKAHVVPSEYLHSVADLEIVAPPAGKIFHNADTDFAVFHIVHHAGVGRTVKKSAAFVIVDVVPDIG